MIKKVQQDLRAFFFTQDKYISHDKHLKPTPPPPQKLRWWYYYSHVVVSALSSTMNTCQRKKQSIICQIYLLVLSTQCQNTISAELLSYLTVIFLLWKPNIWALLSVRKSHNRIPQSMIWNFSGGERASMFRFLPFVIVGQLNWRDPLGHHPTLWYILQYELWIDFIYTRRRHRKVKWWMEMGFFDSSTKWIWHKLKKDNESLSFSTWTWNSSWEISHSKIQLHFLLNRNILRLSFLFQKYFFDLWISKKNSFIHIFLSPSLL